METERKAVIQPHTRADDLRQVPEPLVRRRNGGHKPSPPTEINPSIIHLPRQPRQGDNALNERL